MTMMFDVWGKLGCIGFHARSGGDGKKIQINIERFRSAHLGRVINHHVMMYSSTGYLMARSVFQILSILCAT